MKANRLFPLLTFLAFLPGCSEFKSAATGPEDEILVFADDDAWTSLEAGLRRAFQDTVFTPQAEAWYTLKRAPFAEYANYERSVFRIVIAPLDGTGPVAAFVSESLDSTEHRFAADGKEYVVNRYEPTARGQLLMFLAGPNLPFLKGILDSKSRELLSYFKEMALRRDLENLYYTRRSENFEIERALLDRCQWTMSVPRDFAVSIDSTRERFFQIRSGNPGDVEQRIFVTWLETAKPEMITEQFVINTRNSLTRRYLQKKGTDKPSEIDFSHLQIQKADFLRRLAFETRGIWKTDDKSEGPFVNYTFFDVRSRRIYMMEGSIHGEAGEKRKMIRQLDGILHTFQTADEVTADDRRDMGY